MIWVAIAAGVVVVAVAAVMLLRKSRRGTPAGFAGAETYRTLMGDAGGAPVKESAQAEALRQNLRVKLLYQEEKVNAAIAFERERTPAASIEDLMRAAIDRWERDNR